MQQGSPLTPDSLRAPLDAPSSQPPVPLALALPCTLDSAPLGQPMRVLEVRCPPERGEWARWLEEIGFLPGEQLVLKARGAPGGDPLVVRIGVSTFALRRAEAACVHIEPA